MCSIIRIALCLSLLTSSLAASEQQPAETVQSLSNGTLPTGIRIPAILKSPLSSNKAKLNDPVRLEVVVDVHDKSGAIVIPRHSKLYGKVTQVVSFERKKQPAMLSFSVDRVEWKGHSLTLDAPVFSASAMATDSQKGEMVEGIPSATLRHADSLNLVRTEIMYDFRLPGNVPQAVHDTTMQSVIMQIKLLPDAAVRTSFVKKDSDLELPSGFMVVLLNGMKVAD
jgi:hypothetical protein